LTTAPTAAKVYEDIDALELDYDHARTFLVDTGNPRVLPGVVNGYVFLASLLYEADAKAAGDALTRDFLCVLTRTVCKKGGSHFYANQKYLVRYGFLCVRDLLVYGRDKCSQDGFEPVAAVRFSSESFDDGVGKRRSFKRWAAAPIFAARGK